MDFSSFTHEEVNAFHSNTIMEALGITCIELGANFLKFSMPVDHRTHQPMGILHGGASAVLVETVGSFGSFLMAQGTQERPVGLSVYVEHIKAVRTGTVVGTGTLVHAGAHTHIWEVDIREAQTEQLIATGRLTIKRIKK